MSAESSLLSRNALVVTVLEPFEIVTGIICKKVSDLTELLARLYFECLEMFRGAISGAIIRSYLFDSESVNYNLEQNGF